MSSISFSPAIFSRKMTSIFPLPSRCRTKAFFIPGLDMKSYHKNLRCEASLKYNLSTKMGLPVIVACSGKDSACKDDDRTALETVLKLYTAIRNKNINELSDIIGEECLCSCNFVSTFQPFYGKKQVLDFLSSLMKFLGDHIEFVVQPTLHDGMSVGVSWKLECSKTHISFGKGFSLHTCHNYQGKVIIKNLDMFMEPLLHIEPLRLKIISLFANTTDGISRNLLEDKARATLNILFTFLLVVALLFFFCRHRQHSLRLIIRPKR